MMLTFCLPMVGYKPVEETVSELKLLTQTAILQCRNGIRRLRLYDSLILQLVVLRLVKLVSCCDSVSFVSIRNGRTSRVVRVVRNS